MDDQLGMTVCAVEPIIGLGKINAVFRVDCEQGTLILRLRRTVDLENNYAKEAWCLERASMAGIPVPTARAHGEVGPYSYIVEDFIAGRPASSEDVDVLKLWEKLGAYAVQINRIGVSGS